MKQILYSFAAVLILSICATTSMSAQVDENPHDVKQMQKEAKVEINAKQQTKAKAIGVGERPNAGPADKGSDDNLKMDDENKEKALDVDEKPNSSTDKKGESKSKKELNKKAQKKAKAKELDQRPNSGPADKGGKEK
jgi:hypothetical protein